MAPRTLLAAARRCGRHCRTVLRSFSPAGTIAITLAVLLGGAGIASAANGGNFILGTANSETATADLIVQQADGGAVCFISKGSAALNGVSQSNIGQPGIFTVTETAAVRIKANDTLQEHCVTPGNNGSVAIDAGITAIRIRSSHGTPPARTGHPVSATSPHLSS